MTRISFWQPAGTFSVPGKGEFEQKFALDAWARQIGKQVPMTGPGGEDMGLVTLVAADVDDGGGGVTLTFEAPESYGPVTSPAAGGMSFAFREPEPLPRDTVPLEAAPPRITWKS